MNDSPGKPDAPPLPPDVLLRLREVVGPRGVVDAPADMAPYVVEERGLYRGAAALVLRPASTPEVAELVRICAAHGVAVVPQGGRTGLVGGGVPDETGRAVVLSLGRMNRVRAIDPFNDTITVDAGCVLADIQKAAAEAGRLFPLSLAAEGSCQIGGNLATNAGGTNVLRYGNAREQVLGLEVVLADGRVWDGLRGLRKDNTGYDLRDLFVGSEGTLGVITGAVLKLFPRPEMLHTALAAIRDPTAAIELLARLRASTGGAVTAFELMSRLSIEMVLRHVPGTADPLARPYEQYLLIELSEPRAGMGFRAALEDTLGGGAEDGLVLDAVLAASVAQARQLWRLRETINEAQKPEGGSIKHDVAVPVSRVPEFLERATAAVEAALPAVRIVAFGHVGDGNIHFNLSQPLSDNMAAERADFLAQWALINRLVHDIVVSMGGSISAEHGIGRLKRDELAHYKAPVELDVMRRIKAALDPRGIMNPGKIL
ncbi:MAG: FAD-binding oxidoreductase [Alphaproteobacteria bacterium]